LWDRTNRACAQCLVVAIYIYGTREGTHSADCSVLSKQDTGPIERIVIMPSIFSKISGSSKRNNPYANPHHPSRTPLPQKHITDPMPIIQKQTDYSANSDNLLAEARQVVNRHPITGQLLPGPTIPSKANAANNQPTVQSNVSPNATEPSAYASRASRTVQTMGSKYELFSNEERRRIAREERIRIARGGGEFYAPERKLDEYYNSRVDDW
jgi:hypothetical protein